MGGTRFNARGIDDEGSVANHVEIEQICFISQDHEVPLKFLNQQGENACVTKTTVEYSFV
jgi:hypothetical protein